MVRTLCMEGGQVDNQSYLLATFGGLIGLYANDVKNDRGSCVQCIRACCCHMCVLYPISKETPQT
jgi:hypothetical protein